ncbi:MAG: efflux RND transporter periplasmic adaptor subunit [Paludibacteraceae bacterium]|nr:efflux RND transporter periplasmic adaptor subunit [Paludibacteraceae bacterium]
MNKVIKLTFVLVLGVMLASCTKESADTSTTESVKKEKVEIAKIEMKEIDREVHLPSTLQGYETRNISSTISGIIDQIFVEVGDKVAKGQLLVRMDPTQYTNYKLQYANLGVEMERVKALKEAGSVSQQTYDQTKVQYDQLGETLALYEKNTFVKADFSGVITAKNFESGELCASQPILALAQINVLKAYINIPELYFPQIKKGMPLTLKSEIYPDKEFKGTVEIVYPTIDVSSHTFTVKVKIPNSSELLRPGMYVNTTLPVGKASTLVVPYQAVLKLIGSNNRYIFIRDGDVAKRVDVELGQRFDKYVEIIGNVKEGDEIITMGQGRLVDGSHIEVVTREQLGEEQIVKE